MSTALTWVLVAVGGAVGTAVGLLVLRRPSPARLTMSTAAVCGAAGALSTLVHSAALTAMLGFGVLGSAASMVAVGTAGSGWLSRDSVAASMVIATRKIVLYCAMAVSFALLGYLAVRGGYTLYRKLT